MGLSTCLNKRSKISFTRVILPLLIGSRHDCKTAKYAELCSMFCSFLLLGTLCAAADAFGRFSNSVCTQLFIIRMWNLDRDSNAVQDGEIRAAICRKFADKVSEPLAG